MKKPFYEVAVLGCMIVLTYFLSAWQVRASVSGPHTTIAFEEGQFTLTEAAKRELTNVVNEARAQMPTKIGEIKTVVWSDNLPPQEGASLSKSDRALAAKRGKAVEQFLKKDLKLDADVKAINMSERPSWMARLFHTDEAKVKSTMRHDSQEAREHIRDTATISDEELRIIKEHGKPSSAVVLIELE